MILALIACFRSWLMTLLILISKVLFPEVSGSSLDSHHGFIVEYGKDRDVDLGFHVDDSEVSLNVCLGKISNMIGVLLIPFSTTYAYGKDLSRYIEIDTIFNDKDLSR